MADTYCTAFMEDLPPEKQAEGLGVQAAVVLGECFHCEHYARCSTDETFAFPANAACMVRKDMLLEKYTGITARPYTAYSYYDAAGDYIGDSNETDLDYLLEADYVEVRDG